jgi:predicted nucleotidyltransferase
MYPLIETNRAPTRAHDAAKYGVGDVRMFGSMARGDAVEASDVDLLVRPLPGTTLLDLGGLLADVEQLLDRGDPQYPRAPVLGRYRRCTVWAVVEQDLGSLSDALERERSKPEQTP